MKSFDGYLKKKLGDSYVLLAGGGHKSLDDFSMAHNHPYIPMGNFASSSTTIPGWGTLTSGNGYSSILTLTTSGSGAIAFAQKAGGPDNQVSMQIDGYFYQNEGKYRVLDEYDISHTKWGDADKLDGYHLSDLYWANIKVQTSSDSTKVPTFSQLYLTNNNAYIYFTSGTNVGILQNYQNALHWYYGDGNTNSGININSSNNIGLGTSSPTAKLHVNGGVVVSNNTIWVQSNNSYGGSGNRMTLSSGHPSALPYTGSNTGKVGTIIYANGIGFRDTLNFTSGSYTYGNDSGWIRVIEEEANNGMLEIATGDDGTEPIRFRRYNTSSQIVSDVLVPNATGTLALTSDIKNAALTLQMAGTTSTTFYANDSTNRTFNVTCAGIGAAAASHKHAWGTDITGRPIEDSGYDTGTFNWGWNPMSLSGFTNVYGRTLNSSALGGDIATFQWFLCNGPEASSYQCMNLSMDGNMQCLGSMYADKNLFSNGKLGVGTISPSYKVHVNNGDIYTNQDMRARRLYLNDSNAFVYFTSGSNIGILQNYNGALHWYFGEGNTNSGININSSNNIGLGTSSPTAKLHVNGDVVVSNNTIWVQSSTSYSGSSNRMSISSGHPVGLEFSDTNSVNKAGVKIWANGIGIKDSYYNGRNANDSCWIRHIETTNNAGYMEIATGDDSDEIIYFNHYNTSSAIAYSSYIQRGNHYAVNFYTTSDRNKKQNISSFSEHIRKFQLKDTEKWHYGVIAQEVPKLFVDGEEGNMTVNYNSMLSYYIGLLENRVAQLESELKALKEKLGSS